MIEACDYDFGVAIGALFKTFGQESSEAILLGYWMGLNDIELATVQRAIARAIRECERLPKPVELRRLAGESTDEQAATIAWDDVLRAIPCGAYKHVDFSNRTINAVIRNMGGWPNFVSRFTDAESEKWVRNEFIRAYRNLSNAGLGDEAIKPLAGLAEVCDYGDGKKKSTPLLIHCHSHESQRLIGGGANQVFQRIEQAARGV